ncbi:MAG: ATP-grasp domain-containing protein [Chloroflexota bacterium]
MKRVVLLCPNSWDEVQLAACRPRWEGKYTILPHGRDVEDNPGAFEALGFVEDALREYSRQPIDGVTSSSDYPGCLVAAAIASELGLPGPRPEQVLRCSHKYYARLAQQEAAPEATPRFSLIDPQRLRPDALELEFPLFVKPVKSWFSVFARQVESFDALQRFLAQPDLQAHLSTFVSPFNQFLARYTDFRFDGGYLLAEELLSGDQVTVEGFVFQGEVTIIGIVDSVMYPGTISFQRFDYPSSLPDDVQARMEDVARRVMRHMGFEGGLFNVELFYDRHADQIHIIEINPRMCGQFADLMELVNGTNTYEILLALAAGERPVVQRGQGPCQVAASFALRAFEDKIVRRVPDRQQIDALRREFLLSVVKVYYRQGERLSERDQSDGYSHRYAIVNMGGQDRPSLLADFAEAERRLGFALQDVM